LVVSRMGGEGEWLTIPLDVDYAVDVEAEGKKVRRL